MLDFTAIDFETANSFRGSPCSVGLIRVRSGEIVAQAHWLIRPPERVDWFDPWNTAIHGLTADSVAGAPRWNEVLPRIIDFIDDDVVVAHNAAFDTGVIRYACEADGIEVPEFRFLCTLVLARKTLTLPTYRLPFVAESLGFNLDHHHNALADANAVVEILMRLAHRKDALDITELVRTSGIALGQLRGTEYRGCHAADTSSRNFTPIAVNTKADPSGYLYGRVVVFTGALASMTRDIARQECARVGGIPEDATTKRTNVLVVGDINPLTLRPGSEVTGKARRAFQLQDKGQEIEVMTEEDFLNCLEGNRISGVELLLGHDDSQKPAEATNLITDTKSIDRSLLLSDRRPPEPPKPPKPARAPRKLRRVPVSTTQTCSVEGCTSQAMFKTRTKPTWCNTHIEEIQRSGGLRPLESFTHPDDWQLTECLTCTVQAHYRFNYTLDKNNYNELTCRACYWRSWAVMARGDWTDLTPVDLDEAERFVNENGFDYLGPLSAPSLTYDPHHTKCRSCGLISAQRLGDVSFGCSCLPGN